MKTIFIGSLPFKTDENTLRQLLQDFQPVGSVQVYADWKNPTYEPYALAEVSNAEAAVEKLDGYRLGNMYLRVHLKGGVNG